MKLENKRKPGKYDVQETAKELASYTLRITSNEKNFPKRYRFSVVNKIQDKALEVVNCLIMANEIFPNTRLELEQRLLYQKKARAAVRSLMTLMEIAATTFGTNIKTLEYWTKLAKEVYNHTTAWIKKDLERFSYL